MGDMLTRFFIVFVALLSATDVTGKAAVAASLELAGLAVTPHVQAAGMRYRRDPDPSLGARVQIFLRNASSADLKIPASLSARFRGQTPEELIQNDKWAWYDTPSAWPESDLTLPAGAMTVWQFNSRGAEWGVGTNVELAIGPAEAAQQVSLQIAPPRAWLSAVTFLGDEGSVYPHRAVLHIANQTGAPLRLVSCRLWLPKDNTSWRALLPGPCVAITDAFSSEGVIPNGEKGCAVVQLDPLPLTYTAVEVQCADATGQGFSLWAHLRIKRETFDISGGWVASVVGGKNTLQFEPFLKTLKRMHINTAHIADTPGYTDQTGPDGLYTRYPLKYFNQLQPVDHYDTDSMLPRIHAVEFLGEPQYGGGRAVPPMEVWRRLAPYQPTRLPTTLTHSEERVWRYYAGLADFPHYDAYRVSAPSPDAWSKYDRWGGKTIRWGAPLETIGEMCRSLRELNRPMPTAYWSQGAHVGWEVYGGRQRTSPTPDELRLQAYHALSSRITSLYWFNLSLASVVKFPDLIDEITRVGREIRMLDQLYLEGDAFHYEQIRRDGALDWDLATIAGPRGALLFALDLDYVPDPDERIFRFGSPRDVSLKFRLPAHLHNPAEVFRVDGDGIYSVRHQIKSGRLEIIDQACKVAIYVVARRAGLRDELQAKRLALVAAEESLQFDPAHRSDDLALLRSFLRTTD